MTNLMIIGNGFDRKHKLNTCYSHFREYLVTNLLKDKSSKTYELRVPESSYLPDGGISYDEEEVVKFLVALIDGVDECDNSERKWSDLEKYLGEIDFSQIFDNYEDILDKEGDYDGFANVDLNSSISSNLEIPILKIKELFSDWISTINVEDSIELMDFNELLLEDTLFLSFNYTNTLEVLYHQSEENICHIHGRSTTGDIEFGHGNDSDYTDYYMTSYVGSEDDLSAIDRQLRKNTCGSFLKNIKFFKKIAASDIKNIYSFGFSYSEVDEYYLSKLMAFIDSDRVTWYLDNYDSDKEQQYVEILYRNGFKGAFSSVNVEK